MRLPWLVEFSAGLLLRRVLGSEKRPPPRRSRSRTRPTRRSPAAPPPAPTAPAGRPRGPLVGLMLGALAVGLVLMLVFEAWYTRIVGVAALFTFIVSGVFAIAGRDGLIAGGDE
jgi:predicted lipid-binding transport protein (Tim44 family)